MLYIPVHTNLHTNRILLKPVIKSSRTQRTKIYQDRDKDPLPPFFLSLGLLLSSIRDLDERLALE